MPSIARERTEQLICRIGAYRSARNGYQRVFNRSHFAARQQQKVFFREIVPAGALVFDVGANEGRVTETFIELGARVVAVEPNPILAEKVRARYGSRRVNVEAVAIGAAEGRAELRLGRDSGHSTISPDWQDAVGVEAAARWDGTVEVPVTTLDKLSTRYRSPDFVKIDVEGFEAEVLAGLSNAVPALSFEFQCRAIETGIRCVDRLSQLGDYSFNLTSGEDRRLESANWMDLNAVRSRLAEVAAVDPTGYGDVYAQLPRP